MMKKCTNKLILRSKNALRDKGIIQNGIAKTKSLSKDPIKVEKHIKNKIIDEINKKLAFEINMLL
tara:strand:+ start:1060 stop:1254 length:195 start_codon:yes stop_codon:yes gene_type:complete